MKLDDEIRARIKEIRGEDDPIMPIHLDRLPEALKRLAGVPPA